MQLIVIFIVNDPFHMLSWFTDWLIQRKSQANSIDFHDLNKELLLFEFLYFGLLVGWKYKMSTEFWGLRHDDKIKILLFFDLTDIRQ